MTRFLRWLDRKIFGPASPAQRDIAWAEHDAMLERHRQAEANRGIMRDLAASAGPRLAPMSEAE